VSSRSRRSRARSSIQLFRPDGEQVAFSWDGAGQDNRDIYVTLVGSSEVRRFTSDPDPDTKPTWSPDGRQIAFLREEPDGTSIQLVSALGSGERKLSDFKGADSISWSPDGHWLAAGRSGRSSLAGEPRGIYLIPVEGGDPRPLIASGPRTTDSKPAFSPDGRRLAYSSCSYIATSSFPGVGGCDVHLVELNAAREPSAPPRRLTTQKSIYIDSIAWTGDGRVLVYDDGGTFVVSHLWRLEVAGNRPPERVEVAGVGASTPAISRNRLAFTRLSVDSDIYRFEEGRPLQLALGSTSEDSQPRVSPDGRRLAFTSLRAGGDASDIWVSHIDGSNVRQLTHGPGSHQGSSSWSPDGRRIAFDSYGDDLHFHIWIIDENGGTPRRLTTQPGDESVPVWSRDGQWIYFSADRGTGRDIWRAPPSGGVPERLTRGASGHLACEAPDGSHLLFQLKDADSPLMVMALPTGAARQLVACVRNGAFGVGPQGVYYVPCDPKDTPAIHVMNLDTGRARRLGALDGLVVRPLGLSVSRDGRTILYPRQVQTNADLMLIENFR
jgi:eukaryotic-like serine/threonine-protein kinase